MEEIITRKLSIISRATGVSRVTIMRGIVLGVKDSSVLPFVWGYLHFVKILIIQSPYDMG
jgi:hypothetical protein